MSPYAKISILYYLINMDCTSGKSTLLKMISAGELKLPPRIDYLYVEQEVMADDTSAVDSVLKADK